MFLSDEEAVRTMRSSGDRVKAIRLIEGVLSHLRSKSIQSLPDFEDIDDAVTERSKSIHEAYPVTSTNIKATYVHGLAVKFVKAVQQGVGE